MFALHDQIFQISKTALLEDGFALCTGVRPKRQKRLQVRCHNHTRSSLVRLRHPLAEWSGCKSAAAPIELSIEGLECWEIGSHHHVIRTHQHQELFARSTCLRGGKLLLSKHPYRRSRWTAILVDKLINERPQPRLPRFRQNYD